MEKGICEMSSTLVLNRSEDSLKLFHHNKGHRYIVAIFLVNQKAEGQDCMACPRCGSKNTQDSDGFFMFCNTCRRPYNIDEIKNDE